MSSPEPTPPATPTPVPPKRTRANQDQALANRINQYRAAINFAKTNPTISSLMQTRGYDGDEFDSGIALCDATQAKFTLRQTTSAAEKQANADAQQSEKMARSGFDDFRKIGRVVLKNNIAARSALQLDGRVPSDNEIFLTTASSAYGTVLTTPDYLTALSKRGLNPSALQAEQAKLDALRQVRLAQSNAQSDAKRATVERDAAAKLLDAWWAEFRAVAQVALKEHTGLLQELGL
jgi:hypothetical protein